VAEEHGAERRSGGRGNHETHERHKKRSRREATEHTEGREKGTEFFTTDGRDETDKTIREIGVIRGKKFGMTGG
jgi:hypothetical protein